MSEEKGKISVIVPVYQAEKYLAKALDSVISQDYENWELFLLVRKSSDQSEKIARDYEKKYDSIRMIERGENKAGEARNQGLEKAQGEYVLFLDSDDYLPDASVMQRYVRMAEQTDADIVVANYARLWNGKMLPAVSHASFSRYHRDSQEFQFRGFFSAFLTVSLTFCFVCLGRFFFSASGTGIFFSISGAFFIASFDASGP